MTASVEHRQGRLLVAVPSVDSPSGDVDSRFAAGNEDALEELYRDVSPLIFTLAKRALGSQSDAEDVTQQTFVSAWRGRETFDPGQGSARGWVVGIAKRRIADALADRQRQLRVVDAEGEVRSRVTPGTADVDAVLLAYEVNALGDPQATILSLAFFEGHTHEHIAERMHMPLGTVKSHVRRGLSALRHRWEVSDVAR